MQNGGNRAAKAPPDSDKDENKKRSTEGDLVSVDVEEENLKRKNKKNKLKDQDGTAEEAEESPVSIMPGKNMQVGMSMVQTVQPTTPLLKSPKRNQRDLPKQWFKMIIVNMDTEKLDGRSFQLDFSMNFVVRNIGRTSPVFLLFLVGDQILEVNGLVPNKMDDFTAFLENGQTKFTFKVLRPWNVAPPTELRQPLTRIMGQMYLIVEVARLKGFLSGFDIRFTKKDTCVVCKLQINSRAAFAFCLKDRLLDVEGVPIAKFPNALEIKKKFNETISRTGSCTFLIERAVNLNSSQNPSCYAKRTGPPVAPPPINPHTGSPMIAQTSPSAPTVIGEIPRTAVATGSSTSIQPVEFDMADDAIEIGCREACRHEYLKDKYRPVSALRDPEKAATCGTEEGEEGKAATNRKRSRKRHKKKITIESKNETHRTPSDVRDPSLLQKVTAESDFIRFVKSKIGR